MKRFPLRRLLLLLLVAGLWLWSYRQQDLLGIFLSRGRVQMIGSDRGTLILATSNIGLGHERAFTLEYLHSPLSEDTVNELEYFLYQRPPLPQKKLGIFYGQSAVNAFGLPGAQYGFVILPLIYPTALVGLWFLLGLYALWRRRKWGRGTLCRRCGYDLRASTDRCPECGTPIAANITRSILPV